MSEPLSLDIATPTTTLHAVALYTETKPLLVALRDLAAPQATKRADRPVPNAILDEARHLLAATHKLVSRQPGARRRLRLGPTADWATLLGAVEFALVALDRFRTKYSSYDKAYGSVVWRDEIWRDLTIHGSESVSDAKH